MVVQYIWKQLCSEYVSSCIGHMGGAYSEYGSGCIVNIGVSTPSI